MHMKMTARDRYIRSLKGGSFDRFYRYEHGPWPTTRERWITEGLSNDMDFSEYFDMDPLVRIDINSGYTDSPYFPPFAERTTEETPEYRCFQDKDGILKRILKVKSDTSMPQFLKFPVRGRDDWKRTRARLDPADAESRIGDASRLRSLCNNPDVPTMLPICGAFGHPRNLFGEEGLSYVIYDDPSLLEEILDLWLSLYEELFAKLTAYVRVDALLIWEDMCYKNGPLISPDHFKAFMIPRYQKLIGAARSCGIEAIIVDTDGECRKLIPLFLDVGVDCLMPFEVQAGMDVVAISKEYPELSIMGGIDKRVLAGDRGSIKREVDRVLPFFRERGRFIPTLDHTVPPNVPLENFRWYLECVRRYE